MRGLELGMVATKERTRIGPEGRVKKNIYKVAKIEKLMTC